MSFSLRKQLLSLKSAEVKYLIYKKYLKKKKISCCVQRERGEHEFEADVNEYALAAFAARNRVLRIRDEREFAAKL